MVLLSSGVVNTSGEGMSSDGMSPEMRRRMIDSDTSMNGMIDVLEKLSLEGSGRWYRFAGVIIFW